MNTRGQTTFNALSSCAHLRAAKDMAGGENSWAKNYALHHAAESAKRQMGLLLGPYADHCRVPVARLIAYLGEYSLSNQRPDAGWKARVSGAIARIEEALEMPEEYASLLISDAVVALTAAVVPE